ncbi:MAG: L-seryl-tRNA(Sec) selenium transferase [Deltaproteobacteria bacterium]|jgi:L-seryl-tRNA(Ser) seleniumtransferase|nr:L-seryl-tRNA(Sec) selenium transferase [Deltaproteobacteria bacterium]
MTAENTSSGRQRLFRALPSVDLLLKALADARMAASPCPGRSATAASRDSIAVKQLARQRAPRQEVGVEQHLIELPRAMLRDLVNAYLEHCREGIKSGSLDQPEALSLPGILPGLLDFLRDKSRPHFRRVLNATGVVIHTNLGRSRLAEEAVEAVAEAAAWYSNLEFNLESGERGSRYSHVEELLCSLTGAEAALVVNNNAAAVLLVLDTLCKGREVIVSRGELVEIGGSFRIPEVMSKSGCILREVGASNRAHLRDYREAINGQTAALMKVHTSNYRVIGFHSEVGLEELKALGQDTNLPLIVDLGSGNLCDFAAAGLFQSPQLAQLSRDEPRVQKVVADGADIVTFSGDKVLGGPQAGIIVGSKAYVEQIKKNALNRALRIDKMTLAALEATLRLYCEPELARRRVPTLRMICAPQEELLQKARNLARKLRTRLGAAAKISVRPGTSLIGGGSFPERHLPTSLVTVEAAEGGAKNLRERLLKSDPPLVARIEDDKLCLDVRTLETEEFGLVRTALAEALKTN